MLAGKLTMIDDAPNHSYIMALDMRSLNLQLLFQVTELYKVVACICMYFELCM